MFTRAAFSGRAVLTTSLIARAARHGTTTTNTTDRGIAMNADTRKEFLHAGKRDRAVDQIIDLIEQARTRGMTRDEFVAALAKINMKED